MVEISNQYILQLKTCLITFEDWKLVYDYVKKTKCYKRYGYGLEVIIEDSILTEFPFLGALRSSLNLQPKFYFLISHAKQREFPIHIDGDLNGENSTSLNWPIQHCDNNSKTTWYEVEKPAFKCIDGSYFLAQSFSQKEVFTYSMQSKEGLPYLFRSDVLHTGYCGLEANKIRIIVKWMLNSASWKEAYANFQYKNLL